MSADHHRRRTLRIAGREIGLIVGFGLLVLLVVGLAAGVVSRSAARQQALSEAGRTTDALASIVVAPLLPAYLNDPQGSVEALDHALARHRAVRHRVPRGGLVIVGFDYWQVLSHYPGQVAHLMRVHAAAGDTVHVVSAVGAGRVGTVAAEVRAVTPVPEVHEVVFRHPRESPVLKLAKCQELGIEVFYDDREDVCRLLSRHGILALRVTRDDDRRSDVEAERA